MPTPKGCLKSISTVLKRLARNGDVDGIRAYVRSDAFLMAFTGLDERRQARLVRMPWRSQSSAKLLGECSRIEGN